LTWWTDYQVRRGQDRKTLFTDNMKNLVSTEFENSTSYNLVKINNIDKKTRIVEENSLIKSPNRKRLLCFPDETIDVGEYVVWNNENWLCVNNDITSQISDVGIIEKCNNTLTFYNNHIEYNIPCVVGSQISLNTTLSSDDSKYLSVLGNDIFVRVGNNAETSLINVNDKFKLGLWNYVVESISDIVENGLLIMKMCFVAEETVLPVYTLEILNGNSIQVNSSDSLTINAVVKADGVIVSPTPSLLFSSSNTLIATINASTGVVTILDIGTVVFTCKLASDLSVLDTISVEIVEVAVDNYTYTLVGSSQPDTEIKSGVTKIYTAHKYNNGVEVVADVEFAFSVIAGTTPSSAYTFSVIDENSCSIKCLQYTYYVTLRATDVSNDAYVDKVVKLRSII